VKYVLLFVDTEQFANDLQMTGSSWPHGIGASVSSAPVLSPDYFTTYGRPRPAERRSAQRSAGDC
jgi:hypothetical protein